MTKTCGQCMSKYEESEGCKFCGSDPVDTFNHYALAKSEEKLYIHSDKKETVDGAQKVTVAGQTHHEPGYSYYLSPDLGSSWHNACGEVPIKEHQNERVTVDYSIDALVYELRQAYQQKQEEEKKAKEEKEKQERLEKERLAKERARAKRKQEALAILTNSGSHYHGWTPGDIKSFIVDNIDKKILHSMYHCNSSLSAYDLNRPVKLPISSPLVGKTLILQGIHKALDLYNAIRFVENDRQMRSKKVTYIEINL